MKSCAKCVSVEALHSKIKMKLYAQLSNLYNKVMMSKSSEGILR